jgi:DNA-3-methyladenine glycosylase II
MMRSRVTTATLAERDWIGNDTVLQRVVGTVPGGDNVAVMRVRTLDRRAFRRAAAELAASDEQLGAILDRHGVPDFWTRPPGFATLLLLILEQQVSLASARAAFDRVAARTGGVTPEALLSLSDDELRADGFSRQKTRYGRALSEALLTGSLDLDALAFVDDDGVRTALVALPGIGPWTAEVYLLAALRRPDTWPTGDVALQEAARRALTLAARPSAAALEEIGERWRPHRATAARLLWHLYLSERENGRRPLSSRPVPR